MPRIDRRGVSSLLDRARRDVDSGLLPAGQFTLAYKSEIVVAESLGECENDTLFAMFSAVKPTVSLTALQLAAEGHFDVDAPVSDILPTFAGNDKQDITVSQVLLHAGGFPYAGHAVNDMSNRLSRLEAYAKWQTDWPPGSRYEYHPASAHWVIADIIEEITGRYYADAIADAVLKPVGRGSWLTAGSDPANEGNIAELSLIGTPISAAEFAAIGLETVPDAGITEEMLMAFNEPWMRAIAVPAGGGFATATDIALWYQAVLHNTGGLLHPEVRADAMVVRQRAADWFGVPSNRSHAFVIAGDDGKASLRGHGHGASPGAFGHGGTKCQIGWADPASGISFSYLTNGLDRNDLAANRRRVSLSSKALACFDPR